MLYFILDHHRKQTSRVLILSICQTEAQTNRQTGTQARGNNANGLSSSQEEDLTPPRTQKRRRRTRPLADIIWENQLLYNDFIQNKVPRLLHQLDVEKSSDESN
jgi:hypothetical protein